MSFSSGEIARAVRTVVRGGDKRCSVGIGATSPTQTYVPMILGASLFEVNDGTLQSPAICLEPPSPIRGAPEVLRVTLESVSSFGVNLPAAWASGASARLEWFRHPSF